MTEDEIKSKVRNLLRSWINDRILKDSNSPSSAVEMGVFADWEDLLNRLNIRRIEHHLPPRPRREGYIRMLDPYCIGINRKRDIEISLDTVEKLLILGIP